MSPQHIPVLDGLRAFAVLLVLWCHVPVTIAGYPEWLKVGEWLLRPGNLGVELFFVLSGFLITRILLAERERGTPVRWFLLRRLLRIFPIYYLLLLVMAAQRPAAEIGWCAAYLFNIVSIVQPMPGPLEHTWSLCVEEHFYLLWPLLASWLPAHRSKQVLQWVVIPLAIGTAIAAIVWWPQYAPRTIERFTPCRCLGLAAGALLAHAEARVTGDRRFSLWFTLAAAVVLLVGHPHVLFLFGPYWAGSTTGWFALDWAVLAWRLHTTLLCTVVVMWCLRGHGSGWSVRWLAWAPLRGIGRISYGLYLYHLPIYYWLAPTPTLPEIWLAVGATFAAAIGSYFVVERPLQRFGARFRGRRPAAPRPEVA
ncbi:MAG: acyltransferase [Planctomycetes bacterium]|jgi:peptidoglycan/LPS O-acetylase OafA/YrhL|nr:acyltransferase [Planctomycetota bacterium]